jgi:hypothetical protein
MFETLAHNCVVKGEPDTTGAAKAPKLVKALDWLLLKLTVALTAELLMLLALPEVRR